MNLRVFDLIRDALKSAGIEIHAMDLPGHGLSPWKAERATFAHQLQDVLSNLPPRCVLMGWSLGGQFALEIARTAPQRVAGLVLLATTPCFSKNADWDYGLEPTALPTFHATLLRDWRQTLADFIWLQLRGSRHAEQAQQWIREGLKTHGMPRREALAAGLELLKTNDLRRHLANISHPTLLIAGQHDRITPPAALRWMHQQMPRSRHIEIRGAGHAPMVSHVEECAGPLREFLVDVTDLAESKSSWR
jgi:pimeloyl-[acyl-carrier protein] methyl ester esterase